MQEAQWQTARGTNADMGSLASGFIEAPEQQLWRDSLKEVLSNGDTVDEAINNANKICDAYRKRFPSPSMGVRILGTEPQE